MRTAAATAWLYVLGSTASQLRALLELSPRSAATTTDPDAADELLRAFGESLDDRE